MIKKTIVAASIATAFSALLNLGHAQEIKANSNNPVVDLEKAAKTLIHDKQGNIKYLIGFKPIDTITKDPSLKRSHNVLAELSKKFDEPMEINEEILANATDKRLYAPKDSLASLIYLKEQYGLEAELVLTTIDKVVSVYITEEQAKRLQSDEIIDWIIPDQKMTLSAFGDNDNGSQFSSWGIGATNSTNAGGSGYAYIADIELSNEVMPDWPTVTRMHQNQAYFSLANSYHPAYVIGIAAAKNNSTNARGVFQGNIIHTSILNASVAFVAGAIETAYLDAEAKGKFVPINLSTNSGEYAYHASNINKWFSIVSNRLLVIQSAGNQDDDACYYAYNPRGTYEANPIDGILVVGGYDRNGARARIFPESWAPAGSNHGLCVDIWAPGKDIAISTRADAPYFRNYPETTLDSAPYYSHATIPPRGYIMAAGGTSFAAPFVTGIAASLGNNNSIRPPQMESMLRNTAVTVGTQDNGSPIKSVYYNSNAVNAGMKYITSSLSSSLPAALRDGKFETMAWNAGGFSGGFDFGATNLKAVRFTPHAPGEDGTLNYAITSVNITTGATINVASGSVQSYNHAPVTVAIPSQYSGLLSYRINFSRPNAWVALTEFEAYTQ